MARPKGSKNKSKEEEAPAQERAEQGSRMPSLSDIHQFLNTAGSYAAEAQEASGNLGQFTNQFCERFSLERKAVTWFRQMFKMDRAKQALIWAQLSALMETAGLAETKTLFDVADEREKETAASNDDERDLRPRHLREKDQATVNTERLQAGIKPLEGAPPPPPEPPAESLGEAPGTYSLN